MEKRVIGECERMDESMNDAKERSVLAGFQKERDSKGKRRIHPADILRRDRPIYQVPH